MIKTLGVLAAGLMAAQAPAMPVGPADQGGAVMSSGSGSCSNCGGTTTWEWSSSSSSSGSHGSGGFLHGLRCRLHSFGNSLFGGHGHGQAYDQGTTGGCCGGDGAITTAPAVGPVQQAEPPLPNQPKAMPSGPVQSSPLPAMPEPSPSALPTPGASPAPSLYSPPIQRPQ